MGRGDGEDRRRRARLQICASGIVAALIACFGFAALLGSEPADSRPLVLAAGAVVFGALAALVFLFIGVRSGSRLAWTLPITAVGAVIGMACFSEELHWRWSREDFQSLTAADAEACRAGCQVGWWRVSHIELSDTLVEVWIANDACYNGRALVRPLGSSLGPSAIRDEQVMADQRYAMYLAGWPRPGDFGLVAEQDGPVGAAWYRTYSEASHGHGFISEQVPELVIAVVASHRRQGIGRALLHDPVEASVDQGYPAISLSVAENNPARGLYQSTGFEHVTKYGWTWTMIRHAGPQH